MTRQRYSLVAIVLHWAIAVAIAFQIALGLGLEDLGARGFSLFQLHKSVGIVVLLLSAARLGWRLTHKSPPAREHGWQGRLAGTVHAGLYVFMLGAPLTGWLLVSTDPVNIPTLLFGVLEWPHLPASPRVNGAAHLSHALLGWLGVALILLHVAGALRHQWLLRDGLMARMAPGRGTWLWLALLVSLGAGAALLMLARVSPAPSEPRLPLAAAETPAVMPAADPPEVAADPQTAAAPEPATSNLSQPEPLPVWTIRPGGVLAFTASQAGSTVDGRFARWRGAIRFDPDRPEGAEIRITVDLASATTGDAAQDAMLTGPDFLDSAAQPQAVFTASSVRRTAPGRYSAQGRLSLKGLSRPQTLTFALSGSGLVRHVEGRATIDREAFGVGSGEAAEGLLPTVTLTFSFDATGRRPNP